MSDAPARKYDPIAISSESTVVAEYVPESQDATAYQSEGELEREMIRLLKTQAYEYLPITTEAQLVANLRAQLELLNDITVDAKGIVYVSDTRHGKIYRIENDTPTLYAENLKGANGLLAVGKDLYVLSDGALVKIDQDKKTTVISKGMEGGLDGVVQIKPNEFITHKIWGNLPLDTYSV